MKNSRSGEKIKLTSINELLGVVGEESAMEIEIKQIRPFKDHPFKVSDDEKMQDLIKSIQEHGVITPVLLRPTETNHYEMISGHRRMYAARKAGLSTIPAIVREMTDDESVIAMVDDLNIAAMFCDRLYVLKDGKIVGKGRPEELLTPEFLWEIYQVKTELVYDSRGQLHILYRK